MLYCLFCVWGVCGCWGVLVFLCAALGLCGWGVVFAFSGRFLGWLSDGWIIDEAGKCLLFESDAVRGPGKPPRQDKPVKSVPLGRPVRGALQAAPSRPAGSEDW